MKVLVLGDSQTNAIAKQYKEKFNAERDQLIFLSRPKRVIQRLVFVGDDLVLRSKRKVWLKNPTEFEREINWYDSLAKRYRSLSNERGVIDLTNFDLVLLVGGNLIPPIPDRFNWWHLVEQPAAYSTEFRRAWISEALEACNSSAYKWILQIAKGKCTAKIAAYPNPYINELYGDVVPRGMRLEQLNEMYHELLAPYGIKFMPLPNELYSSDGRAIDKRFKKQTNPNDFFHLNELGGNIVFNYLCQRIFADKGE